MSYRKVIHYILNKLVGAGFSFTFFMFIFAFIAAFNLYELSQTLKEPLLWIAFYVYGVISSIIIDIFIHIYPKMTSKSFILYGFLGIIPFIVIEPQIIFILIAGFIGMVAALLFFVGVTFVSRNKWAAIIFSFLLPFILLFVTYFDFTKKTNWESKQKKSEYEASFTYFNGHHKIPLDLYEGDKIKYTVIFNPKNDGGWGNHFENEKGDYLPGTEDGAYVEYEVQKDDTYFIVVNGDRVKGKFTVKWDIESK